jgi:predicted HTH domain antitoxin
MTRVLLELPDEGVAALHCAPEQVGPEVSLAAAAKLYEMGRISSSAAACLAGLPRTVFLSRLAEFGVESFRLTEDELRAEMADA